MVFCLSSRTCRRCGEDLFSFGDSNCHGVGWSGHMSFVTIIDSRRDGVCFLWSNVGLGLLNDMHIQVTSIHVHSFWLGRDAFGSIGLT